MHFHGSPKALLPYMKRMSCGDVWLQKDFLVENSLSHISCWNSKSSFYSFKMEDTFCFFVFFSYCPFILNGYDILIRANGSHKNVIYNFQQLLLILACNLQLPATLHPGVTVVVCPLLSLIQDQIITLNIKYGIPATFLNSQQTASQASAVIRELR